MVSVVQPKTPDPFVPQARLIIDPPARGTWNMAVDDALLQSAGEGVTTLRLYEWSEPTLSLGYFQSVAEREAHAASRNCPLVRRASGGGAIVHDHELTYCLAMPIAERFAAQANLLYDAVHSSLIESLKGFGVPAHLQEPAATAAAPATPPFLCFQRRTRGDVLCGQAKIAGSAQRRQRGGLVQHGSILLSQSAAAPELPGIEQIAGISLAAGELATTLADQLAGKLGVQWAGSAFTDLEQSRANRCESDRFAAAEWTCRR
jgi:lipoyl(octanoyl) transferase